MRCSAATSAPASFKASIWWILTAACSAHSSRSKCSTCARRRGSTINRPGLRSPGASSLGHRRARRHRDHLVSGVGGQVFILDVYGASNVGLEHYAEVVESRRKQHGWIDGTDFVPHDAKVMEWGIGRTRVESMQRLGLHPMLVREREASSTASTRRAAPWRCACSTRAARKSLITALELYHRKWDDELRAFAQGCRARLDFALRRRLPLSGAGVAVASGDTTARAQAYRLGHSTSRRGPIVRRYGGMRL